MEFWLDLALVLVGVVVTVLLGSRYLRITSLPGAACSRRRAFLYLAVCITAPTLLRVLLWNENLLQPTGPRPRRCNSWCANHKATWPEKCLWDTLECAACAACAQHSSSKAGDMQRRSTSKRDWIQRAAERVTAEAVTDAAMLGSWYKSSPPTEKFDQFRLEHTVWLKWKQLIKDCDIVLVPSPWAAILEVQPGHYWWNSPYSKRLKDFDRKALVLYWDMVRVYCTGNSLCTVFVNWAWDAKWCRWILETLHRQPTAFTNRLVIISIDGPNVSEWLQQFFGGTQWSPNAEKLARLHQQGATSGPLMMSTPYTTQMVQPVPNNDIRPFMVLSDCAWKNTYGQRPTRLALKRLMGGHHTLDENLKPKSWPTKKTKESAWHMARNSRFCLEPSGRYTAHFGHACS